MDHCESGAKVKYRTIVADPPWPYSGGFQRCRVGTPRLRQAEKGSFVRVYLSYASLSIDEIVALPVRTLADTDARLFLWTTNAYLPSAFEVLAEWGFTYRQTIVWWKQDALPLVTSVAPNSGEFLLVGTVGKPERAAAFPSAVIKTPAAKQHSRKPELFTDLIESVSPGPYVELFARRHRLGWDVWGNESANTATMAQSNGTSVTLATITEPE